MKGKPLEYAKRKRIASKMCEIQEAIVSALETYEESKAENEDMAVSAASVVALLRSVYLKIEVGDLEALEESE